MRLLALVIPLAMLLGCSSTEEKIIDRKMQARKALDSAYAAYGGGDLLAQAKAQAAKDPSPGTDGAIQLVAETDRNFFEQYCLAVGNGERPFNFSPKLEGWIRNEGNQALCVKAAKAARAVEELERKAAKG